MRLPACLASCARLLYWIPVTIIGVVLLWSYYAYVVHFCWVMLPSATQRAAFLSLFHVSFGMLSWSFCKAVSTPPASPSVEFQLASSDLPLYEQEQEATEKIRILLHVSQRLPVCTRTASGAIRFCHQCQLIKPDRCHHCSVCQTCVLKMDHHCLWLNNCIGFSNYKFFVLFLLYTLLYCLLIIATVTPTSLSLWRGKQFDSGVKLHVLFLTLVSGVFGVTLCFLLLFHLWLLASNRTTLEWLSVPFFADGPGTESFDVGLTANVLQVLGQKKKLWLIPVFSRCESA